FPFLLLILATLCWGANFVVGRALNNDIPPLAFNFWRWTIALVFLLPFSGFKVWQYRRIVRRHLPLIIMLSCTGVAGFNSLIYTALHSTTAINAALMISTVPLLVPTLSYLFFKTPLTGRQALGTAVSMVGALVVIAHGNLANILALDFSAGDLLVLTAAFFWSLYTAFYHRRPREIPPVDFLVIISLLGVLMLLPFYLHELITIGGFALNRTNVIAILYVALFASVIAFIAWNYGVLQVGANRAGLFIHFMPVFSAILAIIFLHEKLYMYHFVGVAFVSLGIVLSSRSGVRAVPVSAENGMR
ncbi:MAG: DMT family transporter, partial [Deltaproteobacteria bacterium]|nr:DMT family transporter [Deltaproteobacteria bacterium]